MAKVVRIAMVLLAGTLIPAASLRAQSGEAQAHYEIGIVYYADGGGFKALNKEDAPQSGRSNYAAWVKGAHATVRLAANQPQLFRVCGVDPTRFKLLRFNTKGDARTVTIAKSNMWIGGTKTVVSESEIPLQIQSVGECFTLAPQHTLAEGEYGFSPTGSLDAFMFGVGDISHSN